MGVCTKLLFIALTLTLQKAVKNEVVNYGLPILTMKLFNALEENSKNVLISPAAVQTNLGLAFYAANSETSYELLAAFNGGNAGNPNMTIKRMALLREKTRNAFCIEKRYEIDHKLLNLTRKHVGTQNKLFDSTYPENAAREINTFVMLTTNNKIENLIDEEDIDESINGILVHTIKYSDKWEDKFSEAVDGEFRNGTHSYYINMLKLNPAYILSGKLKDLNAFAVMLPFREAGAGMLVLQPDSRNGLSNLMQKLQDVDITEIPIKLQLNRISLQIPKLEINFERSLREPLKRIGVINAFSEDDADFTALLKNGKNSYVKDLKQQAYIKVNASGVSVFSGTSLLWNENYLPTMQRVGIRIDNPDDNFEYSISSLDVAANSKPIKIDRPFFFAILRKNAILFVGTIRNVHNKKDI